MPKKAIIYDLDNTVYPVSSIGEKLFGPLFAIIEESGKHNDDMEAIKKAIMRTPFKLVAKRFNFSDELTQKGIELQTNLEYKDEIKTFDDYPEILNIPGNRFLVTTGFPVMQHSKITAMNIREDFNEIHVVDPVTTNNTKKDVFADILQRYNYTADEVIVVGDDPESEIAAAKALGITTVLYDKYSHQEQDLADYTIKHFKELKDIYLNS
ncbi:HAD family hydrolase [Flavobacterium sp. MK4S-17]|uniref:HAD family hydrolase n=1 Tax=Flavobacterium sp. MK4S-17 TaxID=2543737 RepID=UPI00135C5F3A|nr:HAD family hydrolase [Flavobacterium sp. MK4S-17]